jgi:hypothetical protein
MKSAEIPADIRQFVLNYAQSVAYVEALMLLRGAPDIRWNSAALANRLYITADEAEKLLQLICRDSFAVEQAGSVRGPRRNHRAAREALSQCAYPANKPDPLESLQPCSGIRKRVQAEEGEMIWPA